MLDVGDLVLAVQRVDRAEALTLQAFQPAAELVALAADHMGAEVAVGAGRVARDTHLLRDVEDDRHRQHVVLAGDGYQLSARLGLDVRGVHDGQPAGLQPLAGDVVQQLERLRRGGLVVLVVGHQAAAEVRRDHLGGAEMRAPEGRLARAAHADQHHQAQLRYRELASHAGAPAAQCFLLKTAICVGGPTSGSSAPTGR